MATDSTNLPLGEANVDAGSDTAGSELDLTSVQLAQVDGAQPVELPKGNQVALIPVRPGQVIELPTDSAGGLLARIGPEGNLAMVVDGRTIILQGYLQANEQSPVRIVTSDGDPVDVAELIAATDPSLDIQTAAGPAAGDQGDAAQGSGIFVPFAAGPGLGGFDAIGVLDPTALQYRLIDDERKEFTLDEDRGIGDIGITFDILGGIVNEDDLPASGGPDLQKLFLVVEDGGNDGKGNDEFDTQDREPGSASNPPDADDIDDNGAGVDDDREPLYSVATVKVGFPPEDVPGSLTIDTSLLPAGLKSEGQEIIYQVIPAGGGAGNQIIAFVNNGGVGDEFDADDRIVFKIEVDKDFSDSLFEVKLSVYDNIDNALPDLNGDGKHDLLSGEEQILGLPVHMVAKDSDGSTKDATLDLGIKDDKPFFGKVISVGDGGIDIVARDPGVTHDETLFPQGDADDQSVLGNLGLLSDLEDRISDAGFSLPFGDSQGATLGIAQTQVFASFGADQATKEHEKDADDATARNSLFGTLLDRSDSAIDDGEAMGKAVENERPFELFMIANGTGNEPAEFDDPNTPGVEVNNLTIADQPTNATVTWNGKEEQVFLRQIDAQTIVGFIEVGAPASEEAVFVINIDDRGVLSFVQIHQLNHPDTSDHDEDLTILGEDGNQLVHVRITDFDGDHNHAPVNIVVQDDGPKFVKVFWGFDGDGSPAINGVGLIDEDKLPLGNNDKALGDDPGATQVDGEIFFDFGTDQPGKLSIEGLTVTNSKGENVPLADLHTADGHKIIIEESAPDASGKVTLIGYVDVNNDGKTKGDQVFKFSIDTEGGEQGEFDFNLYKPLEHPFTDSDLNNDDVPQSAFEDNLKFDFTIRGSDVDKDHDDGHIVISIDDDVPVSKDDTDSVTEGKGNTATGNVVTGANPENAFLGTDANKADGTKDAPGADQPYVISKLQYGGTTFYLNDLGGGSFSVTKGAPAPAGTALNNTTETFDGQTLKIPTLNGGSFEIVMQSPTLANVGEYRYTAGDAPGHDSDKHGGPASTAASLTADFDQVSEWQASFAAAGVTLVPGGGSLALKNVNVAGPNDYRGIGVSGGIDGQEVDTAGPQTLTLNLAAQTNNAALTIAALFDGAQFDHGAQEILLWQVFNGGALVASGQILGENNGLATLDIDTGGSTFNKIVLTPLSNGEGNSGDNSDFLLLNIEICAPADVKEEFLYTLQDADGDESTSKLTVNVDDTGPTIPTPTSGSYAILVDEDGIKGQPGPNNDGVGNTDSPYDAEEDHSAPNAAKDDAQHKGFIPYVAGADPITIESVELTVGPQGVDPLIGGDTGLRTHGNERIFAAWDDEANRLVGYVEGTNPIDSDNQIFLMQIDSVSGGKINYTFTLLQSIEHADIDTNEQGDNENTPDPFFNIQIQVEDTDCDVAYTTLKVTIDDDMPVIKALKADGDGLVVHDESIGEQGEDQENGELPQVFKDLTGDKIIGWAEDEEGESSISAIFEYGADGPGDADVSLDVAKAGGTDSGLFTTGGAQIWLFEDLATGLVVGRVGKDAGGVTPDASGKIAFAINIEDDGDLQVAQYLALKHPDPASANETVGLKSGSLLATLTVTDDDNDSVSKSVDVSGLVKFADAVDRADDDIDFVQEDGPLLAYGNVVTGKDGGLGTDANSTDGDADLIDSDGLQTPITWFEQGTSTPDADGIIAGKYGTLKVTGNGDYEYSLNNSNKEVQGLSEGEFLQEQFKYQIKDGDNDTDSAILTIKIKGKDDGVTITDLTPRAEGGDAIVKEEALNKAAAGTDGSNPSSTEELGKGTFKVIAPDGLDDIFVASADGSPSVQIVDNGAFLGTKSFTTDLGNKLTITGFDAATGVVSYEYLLNDDETHPDGTKKDSIFEDFKITADDVDGSAANATLSVQIVDDLPQALGDKDEVSEGGPTIAVGNVITGKDGGSYGTDANGTDGTADIPGADDPAGISKVTNFNGDSIDPTSGSIIAGKWGTLTIDDDGDYKYVLDTTNPEVKALGKGDSLNEQFAYVLKDADGDTSSATLTIAIQGTNEPPTIDLDPQDPQAEDRTIDVSDEGLKGGIKDSVGAPSDDTDSATFSGTFTVSDPDVGDTLTVTMINSGLPAWKFGGDTVTWSLSADGLTLTGEANGSDAITVVVTPLGGNNYKYDVALLQALDHPDATQEDELSLALPFKVTDAAGEFDTATLTIRVEDDQPTVEILRSNFLLWVDETVDAKGGPDVDALGTGVQDGLGAEGDEAIEPAKTNVVTTGLAALSSAPVIGAATAYASTLFLGKAGGDGEKSHSYALEILGGGLTGLKDTQSGQFVTLEAGAPGQVLGKANGQLVFALSINAATGDVTIAQFRAVDHGTDAPVSYTDEVVGLGEGVLQVKYTLTDNDNDTASKSVDLGAAILFDDDGPSAVADTDSVQDGSDDLVATGNVVTGKDADGYDPDPDTDDNLTDGNADALGSDKFGSISWSDPTEKDGIDTDGAIQGKYGKLLVDDDGGYRYELDVDDPDTKALTKDQFDNEVFTYKVTDGDGDSASTTLTIKVQGDSGPPTIDFFPQDPQVKNGSAVVSDEGLAGGNKDSAPAGDDTNSAVATGSFVVSDPDVGETLTVQLSTTGLPTLKFGGVDVVWSLDGPSNHVIHGKTGGTDAITISITKVDNNNYNYSVNLIKPLDHPVPNLEDEVNFAVKVTVSDTTGGTDSALLNVQIEDDQPANNEATLIRNVAEDGLPTGNGGGATVAVFTAAQLSGLVNAGADTPVTIKLNAAIDGADSGRDSKGLDIVFDVISPTQTNGVTSDGRTIFTIIESPAGTFTFELKDQVDHTPLASGGGDAETISLSLANVFTATDFDKDTVVIDAGASVVIENDVPENNTETVSRKVVEDGLPTGNGGGSVQAQFTNAQLTALVNVGADEPVTFKLNPAIDGIDTGLDSKGLNVLYDVISPTQVNGVTSDGRTIFTVIESPAGTFTFTLTDQIDHGALNIGGGDAETVTLDLASLFTATDFDGDQIIVNGGASVVIENDVPQNNGQTLAKTVFEDGLATLLSTGIGGGATSAQFSSAELSALVDVGADEPLTVKLNAAIEGVNTGLDSKGADIFFDYVNATTVHGIADGRTVFTIVESPAGTFTFTLLDQIDHTPLNSGGGDNETISLSLANVFTATDFDGDQIVIDAGASITINNDVPKANALSKSLVQDNGQDTNLLLILDISGSMAEASGMTGLNKLEAAVASIKELLDQYDALGDVRVRLVTFSTDASASGAVWMTIDQVRAVLDTLSPTNRTNYDEALTDAIAAFPSAGKLSGAENVAYFLSDGIPNEPSGSEGINAAEENTWTTFLKNNDINAFALGFGNNVQQAPLDPIAYNGVTETNTNAVIVTDVGQLTAALVATVTPPTTGNILTDSGNAPGADEPTRVSQITFGDSTWTFNGSIIQRTAGTVSWSASPNSLTINGTYFTMVINMLTGGYSYTLLPGAPTPVTDIFGYTIVDFDGDTASNNLTIQSGGTDVAPIIRDDYLFTNVDGGSASIVVPTSAFLWNDTDANGDAITFTAILDDTDLTATLAAGKVTVKDNGDEDGGTFVYSATANGVTSTAEVVVDRQQDNENTLDGDGLDNILVGRDSNDTIFGYEGNDVILAYGGKDTLDGGKGRDWLIGGAGDDVAIGGEGNDLIDVSEDNDTVRYTSKLDGKDVITGFDANPTGGQDVIDLNPLFDGNGNPNAATRDARVSIQVVGSDTVITVDANGNGFDANDVTITVLGVTGLTKGVTGEDINYGSN